MAYRSALDPTATWGEHPYEARLPPQCKVATDADHFGLDKVKRWLTEYLAVVRLRALITEMEQVKAQGVVLKDAIENQNVQDKTSEALVRAGETPSPLPTSMETQGPRKVTKSHQSPNIVMRVSSNPHCMMTSSLT
jgi:hypothetical protein